MDAPVDADLLRVAHVIQLALTPVFLLSGVGALLNVFSGRLARVADQVAAASRELEASQDERRRATLQRRLGALNVRTFILDAAVALGATGGVATSVSVLTLFVGAFHHVGATVLLLSFGAGVVCTVGALCAYLAESLLASAGVRSAVRHAERD